MVLIRKILGKLLQKNEKETMAELPELFDVLAEGNVIDIGKNFLLFTII